jgi:hypothetical protein
MTAKGEIMDFNIANRKVHTVETQWHFKPMTSAGFFAETLEQEGFVRSYTYSKGEHYIIVTTGSQCDYWVDTTLKARGYHGSLVEHLESI